MSNFRMFRLFGVWGHYEPEWGLGGGETRSPRRGEARGSCHTPLEPSGPVHYGKTREQKCTTTQGSWEVIFYFDQPEASICLASDWLT